MGYRIQMGNFRGDALDPHQFEKLARERFGVGSLKTIYLTRK